MMALLKGGFRENFQKGSVSRTILPGPINIFTTYSFMSGVAEGFMHTITGSQGADDNGMRDYLGFSTTDLLTGK